MERLRKLSRRDAVKVIGGMAAVAAGISTPLVKKLIAQYSIEAPDTYSHRKLRPEEVENYIYGKVNVPLNWSEGEHVFTRVSPNRQAFSEAISYITQREFPQNGAFLVRSWLRKFPLEISLEGRGTKPLFLGSSAVGRDAEYTPLLFGGPRLIFQQHFLKDYYIANHEAYLKRQIRNDGQVYHDLVHLSQDVRGSFRIAWEATKGGLLNEINNLAERGVFDPREYHHEKEAIEKADEIVQSMRREFLSNPVPSNWPFGRFFKFSRV